MANHFQIADIAGYRPCFGLDFKKAQVFTLGHLGLADKPRIDLSGRKAVQVSVTVP
jgi:hypothetical protein